MHVGERLATWRKHKGWTQVRLAKQLDISRSAVAQWEDGTTQPRPSHLETAVDALGLTMTRFYGPLPPEANRLLKKQRAKKAASKRAAA